jgi:hypothetical protein
LRAWLLRKRGWRLRSGHWARIQITQKLIMEYPQYDNFLYLDADVVFNHRHINFPLPLDWYLHTSHCNIVGDDDRDHVIFFSNFPQEPHMPCSGVFFISLNHHKRNQTTAVDILQLWWENDSNPYFDTHSEYDQHSLHELIYKYPGIVDVVDIRPFDTLDKEGWIYHFSGSYADPQASFDRLLSMYPSHNLSMLNDVIVGASSHVKQKAVLRIECIYDKLKEGPVYCDPIIKI